MKPNITSKKEMNVYQIVTERIITQLMSGTIPWRKPWCSPKFTDKFVNYVTGRPYESTINRLLLGKPGQYITFNQVTDLKGSIRKGAKSAIVTYWTMFVPKELKQEEKDRIARGENTDDLKVPVLKYYRVFNVNDVEGLPKKETADFHPAENPTDIATFTIQNYCERTGVTINPSACDMCSYDEDTDTVTLPLSEQFTHEEEWYGKIFDGLVRSTALEGRCNRRPAKKDDSSEKYDVKEDLIAEIGSSMLLNEAELDRKESTENTAAACRKWLDVLQNDYKVIISACKQSENAARFILNDTTAA